MRLREFRTEFAHLYRCYRTGWHEHANVQFPPRSVYAATKCALSDMVRSAMVWGLSW